MIKPIRIALTKGRLEKDTVEMFERLGYDCTAVREKGRRLILPVAGTNLEIVLAKAADVATYVDNGVCDIGVVGKDTIMEMGGTFYEVADLGFGKCRFALALPQGVDFYEGYHTRRIASKYVNVARGFFERKSMDVSIVKIEGSVELAPILGLSDAIVDIVETGTTLRENDLSPIETIVPISARLIANKVSFKFKHAAIQTLYEGLKTQVAAKEAEQK